MSPPISTPKKNAQQTRTVNRFLVQKNQTRPVKAAWAAEKKVVRELIPKLKKMGATGIVEFPLNKVLD